jgi:hypothetical protein
MNRKNRNGEVWSTRDMNYLYRHYRRNGKTTEQIRAIEPQC